MFTLLLRFTQLGSVQTALNIGSQSDELERVHPAASGTSKVTFLSLFGPQNANISFGGKNYTSGQSDLFTTGNYTAKVTPNSVGYPQPPHCAPGDFFLAGYSFWRWTTKGNLTITGSDSQNPTSVRVGGVGPGNLTANFIHGDGICANVFSPLVIPSLIGTGIAVVILYHRREVNPKDRERHQI